MLYFTSQSYRGPLITCATRVLAGERALTRFASQNILARITMRKLGLIASNDVTIVRHNARLHHCTPTDVRADDNNALRTACFCGNLATAKWLQKHFRLAPTDARACNNDALRWACSEGHLDVAKWLHTTYHLTAEDARAIDHNTLQYARSRGHTRHHLAA